MSYVLKTVKQPDTVITIVNKTTNTVNIIKTIVTRIVNA